MRQRRIPGGALVARPRCDHRGLAPPDGNARRPYCLRTDQSGNDLDGVVGGTDVDVVDRGHREVRLPVLETIGDVLAGGKDTVMTLIKFGAPSGA